jgi:hypothetical protein
MEIFVDAKQVSTEIKRLTKLGLKLISFRETRKGYYVQFEIPDWVGLGLTNTLSKNG